MIAFVVISPATTTSPVVTIVSQATRPRGSCRRISSSTASEIWAATWSGWPPVTDSDVNRNSLMPISPVCEYGFEPTKYILKTLVGEQVLHLFAKRPADLGRGRVPQQRPPAPPCPARHPPPGGPPPSPGPSSA